MRPSKFAIEEENYIISSLYSYVLRTPKCAIEGENSITPSIYPCDLLSLQEKQKTLLHHQYAYT